MPTLSEVFGDALQPDPAIALPPVPIPVRTKAGPLHRLQFVIEFVGPRSAPAAAVAVLLDPRWRAALGEPQAFVMSPGDLEWKDLAPSPVGSFDSVALAWDLVSPQGELSAAAAQHLLDTAAQLEPTLSRRAMPLPIPEDVPKAIAQLRQVQDNFDAGVSLLVLPRSEKASEFELCVWCAKLGLTPNFAEGTFDFIVPGSPLPLFCASPLGDSESFSLEGAQRGDPCDGLLLGFSVPRSPEPIGGLEAMMRAAGVLAEKMWGEVYDDNNVPLAPSGRDLLRNELTQACRALDQLGMPPGSPEALRLFSAI